MTPAEIEDTLQQLFGTAAASSRIAPGSWQIETDTFRLLILLSEDSDWIRVVLPIMPIQDAQPFLEQLLIANFDDTREVRYALYESALWGVFQHKNTTLIVEDFKNAIAQLISLFEVGLNDIFGKLIDSRIRLIIQAAKIQGQSLETTMQNLDRFYAEGMMGEIEQTAQAREQTLSTWRYQLQRLWNEDEK
jgi:hypothetical protein